MNIEGIEGFEVEYGQRLLGCRGRHQGLQARGGLDDLIGFFQLHHDRRRPGRRAAVDQFLRLRQLHDHRDFVELLESLSFGLQHLERSDIGCAVCMACQQFDSRIVGAARGRGGGGFGKGQRGDVRGQRRAARLGFDHRTGTICNTQCIAQAQHARHPRADDGGVGCRPFEHEAHGNQRQLELIPLPHSVHIHRDETGADHGSGNAGGEIAGHATELQRRRHDSHHAFQAGVGLDQGHEFGVV